MRFTALGLVLATLFGAFFGSEGEMNPQLFSFIFWGLIGVGAGLHALEIFRDEMCSRCHCRFCAA